MTASHLKFHAGNLPCHLFTSSFIIHFHTYISAKTAVLPVCVKNPEDPDLQMGLILHSYNNRINILLPFKFYLMRIKQMKNPAQDGFSIIKTFHVLFKTPSSTLDILYCSCISLTVIYGLFEFESHKTGLVD